MELFRKAREMQPENWLYLAGLGEAYYRADQWAGFLEDDKGNPSSMRLMCAISLIASIAFGFITTLHSTASQSDNGLYITFAFLLGAFAPKAVQKAVEAKMLATGQ
jgi:hypothetical protein